MKNATLIISGNRSIHKQIKESIIEALGLREIKETFDKEKKL
jgi:hypothetical protein